jgi:hypothetical protein
LLVWRGCCSNPEEVIMRPKIKRKHPPQPPSSPLAGLRPGARMKGGVRYDPAIGGFAAIVHVWHNPQAAGEPDEWRAPEVFRSEDEAMAYYKATIRPGLEQLTAELAKKPGLGSRSRRLEE